MYSFSGYASRNLSTNCFSKSHRTPSISTRTLNIGGRGLYEYLCLVRRGISSTVLVPGPTRRKSLEHLCINILIVCYRLTVEIPKFQHLLQSCVTITCPKMSLHRLLAKMRFINIFFDKCSFDSGYGIYGIEWRESCIAVRLIGSGSDLRIRMVYNHRDKIFLYQNLHYSGVC